MIICKMPFFLKNVVNDLNIGVKETILIFGCFCTYPKIYVTLNL